MNCDELVELVTAFLDDALDGRTRERFLEHLALCEGCERYLDQMRITIAQLGRVRPVPLPAESRDRMLAAFEGWYGR